MLLVTECHLIGVKHACKQVLYLLSYYCSSCNAVMQWPSPKKLKLLSFF